eukprot:3560971-Prorocentrum_lima.AAC.1
MLQRSPASQPAARSAESGDKLHPLGCKLVGGSALEELRRDGGRRQYGAGAGDVDLRRLVAG